MKRLLLAAAIANLVGGVVSASTVISCSGTAAAVNSCYASHLSSFQTQLDWAVFGTPDGTVHTGVWTTSTGGVTIDVSSQNAQGLRLADNFASVFEVTPAFPSGHWVPAYNALNPTPYAFPGHFDAPPDTTPSSAVPPGSPGDHLIGIATNGTNTNGLMLLNFSVGLTDIGFRIAAVSNSTFSPRIQAFSGANGTGTLLSDTTLPNLNGGGTVCPGLNVANTGGGPPVPCNDAPFLALLNYNSGISSLIITNNDVDGFYIGNLVMTTPEPTPLILCGFGVSLLLIGKKRWRRS